MDRRTSKLLRPHAVKAPPLAGMCAGQSGCRTSTRGRGEHGASLAKLTLLWSGCHRRCHRCVWDGQHPDVVVCVGAFTSAPGCLVGKSAACSIAALRGREYTSVTVMQPYSLIRLWK